MKTLSAAAVLTAAVTMAAAAEPAAPAPLTRPDPNAVKAYAAAEAVKAAEAKQEKSEAELIRDLDAFLDGMTAVTPDLEKMTAEKVREVAARLHGMGLRILAFHKEYEASNAAMLAAYAKAPAAFRGAGVSYRRFASDEPFEEIKADYLRLAEICDALAGRYEKRAVGLPDEAKEVRETMKFVERTVVYLERHDVLAAAFPDLSAGADRDRFLEVLRKYVEGYKGLRGNLDKFHGKLTAQAMDPRLRPAVAAAAGRPKAPATPAPAGAKGANDGPPPDLTVLIARAPRR